MSEKFYEERVRLIKELKEEGYIFSEKVERAMLKVPREMFVPEDYRELAYVDRPLPIGHGQTISAPSIVAYMTELLRPDIGHKVLEVGTGSGYQAAVLAEIVAPSEAPRDLWGHVYSIERIPELAEFARKNLERTGYSERVTVIVGDGTKGYPQRAPYDRIMVTAAAPDIPKPLVEQLKPSGIMVIPVGSMWEQNLVVVEKDLSGNIKVRKDIEVIFVPLIGEYGWKGTEHFI
jgi:protein-L-isoaspartate(D-aspartate) O-methyltransferase